MFYSELTLYSALCSPFKGSVTKTNQFSPAAVLSTCIMKYDLKLNAQSKDISVTECSHNNKVYCKNGTKTVCHHHLFNNTYFIITGAIPKCLHALYSLQWLSTPLEFCSRTAPDRGGESDAGLPLSLASLPPPVWRIPTSALLPSRPAHGCVGSKGERCGKS